MLASRRTKQLTRDVCLRRLISRQCCAAAAKGGPEPVAVLGTGIMGLTTATQLRAAFPELPIHLIYNDSVPKTTSYGSGGAQPAARCAHSHPHSTDSVPCLTLTTCQRRLVSTVNMPEHFSAPRDLYATGKLPSCEQCALDGMVTLPTPPSPPCHILQQGHTRKLACTCTHIHCHACAGLWEPYQIEGTAEADILRWGEATFDHLWQLFRSPAAGLSGVAYTTAHALYSTQEHIPEPPSWRDVVHNFRELSGEQCEAMGCPGLAGGYAFETLVADQVCGCASAACVRMLGLLQGCVGVECHCASA
jgi:hypothetical protein